MLTYPNIDPIAFSIGPVNLGSYVLGPLSVHWYGLMYLIGFAVAYCVVALRVKTSQRGFTVENVSDILFYIALGVILGGRIGYMLFYDFSDVIHHPLRIFMIWKGGMSFHGGLIGVLIALTIYARKIGKHLLDLGDLVAPAIPIGLFTGRIGNFINGELWGRVTDVPWGIVFPGAGPIPRHPSQLYECLLEGALSFIILWLYSMKPRPRGAVSGLFLMLYGIFRIIVEFYREPDFQVGYLAFGWLTEGQLLSLPMVIIGLMLITYAYRGEKKCSNIWIS